MSVGIYIDGSCVFHVPLSLGFYSSQIRCSRLLKMEHVQRARLLARNALRCAGQLEFKPVPSAKWVDIERSWTGKLNVRIEHNTLRNCTPEMLRWWFQNLGRIHNLG